MKVHYDPDVDIIYLVIKKGMAYDSREIDEDVILELGEDNEVLGIQVMNARKNLIPHISQQLAKAVKSKGHKP